MEKVQLLEQDVEGFPGVTEAEGVGADEVEPEVHPVLQKTLRPQEDPLRLSTHPGVRYRPPTRRRYGRPKRGGGVSGSRPSPRVRTPQDPTWGTTSPGSPGP